MRLSLVAHFFNESLLLPAWLNHHKDMFDDAILINHASTDNSVEIIKSLAPSSWNVIDSKLTEFGAVQNDQEVMEVEQSLGSCWKLCLNVTEFIWTPDFRQKVYSLQREFPGIPAFGMRSAIIVDNQESPLDPLLSFRTHGYVDYERGVSGARRWRYVHRAAHGHYETGRHDVNLIKTQRPEMLLLHLGFSPWPYCEERKLQIQTRIPQSDKNAGFGFQHIQTSESLKAVYDQQLSISYDLLEDEFYRAGYDFYVKSLALQYDEQIDNTISSHSETLSNQE